MLQYTDTKCFADLILSSFSNSATILTSFNYVYNRFTHTMPCPCRAHAVSTPFPRHAVPLRFEIVSFPFDLHSAAVFDHTCHAMPMPCSDRAVLLKATAQYVRRETTCGLPAHVRLLPATTRSSTKVVIRSIPTSDAGGQCETKQLLSWARKRVVAKHYKTDDLFNCWISSSDISGYHADFHEGHGTIGVWQGPGMGTACYVWIGLYASSASSSVFLMTPRSTWG